MKSLKRNLTAVIAAAALIPLGALAHAGHNQASSALGSKAAHGAAMRVIDVTPKTKGVNVNQGDIVTFNVNGKSFTWQFDTLRPSDSFKLASIAPSDIDTRDIRVYVAPNPLYRN